MPILSNVLELSLTTLESNQTTQPKVGPLPDNRNPPIGLGNQRPDPLGRRLFGTPGSSRNFVPVVRSHWSRSAGGGIKFGRSGEFRNHRPPG